MSGRTRPAVRRRRTGAGGGGEDGGEGGRRGTAVSAGSVENNSAAVWGEQRAGADGSQRRERFTPPTIPSISIVFSFSFPYVVHPSWSV